MKSPLLSQSLAAAILLFLFVPEIKGQNLIFSEDFSGFTTGSHETPSTSDVSGALDTRTSVPGWTGYKVYSADGEIKLSTSDVPGWIETPEVSLSGYGGVILLKFDIASWPGDATIVRLLVNGTQAGDVINPSDGFVTIEMAVPEGTASVKVRFESVAKRFYLDNIQVMSQYPTVHETIKSEKDSFSVYPNPTSDIVVLDNILLFDRLEVLTISGMLVESVELPHNMGIEYSMSGYMKGLYLFRLTGPGRVFTVKVAKY